MTVDIAEIVAQLGHISDDTVDVDARIKAIAALLNPPAPPPSPFPPLPPPQPITPPEYQDYLSNWNTAEVHADRVPECRQIAAAVQANAARYESVAAAVGLAFWPLIGFIHNLESSMDFGTHLSNGDPLTGRTVNQPVGNPRGGSPPFTWEFSATDTLLRLEHWDVWHDWSIAGIAYRSESYNGPGYRNRGIPSPYLWAGTTVYIKGFFTSDGNFDPQAVSKEIGVMTMLKYLSGLQGMQAGKEHT